MKKKSSFSHLNDCQVTKLLGSGYAETVMLLHVLGYFAEADYPPVVTSKRELARRLSERNPVRSEDAYKCELGRMEKDGYLNWFLVEGGYVPIPHLCDCCPSLYDHLLENNAKPGKRQYATPKSMLHLVDIA